MLSGHGHDVATLARTTREDWIASADAALSALVDESGGPVAIVGMSAGGLIAMRLALARPKDVRALVLLATPVKLSAAAAAEIRLALLLPRMFRPRSLREIRKPHGPSVNDQTFVAGLRSLPAYPLEALGELLRLMGSVRPRLNEITQPVMIAHGQLDPTVTAAQIDVLAGALTKAARVERLNLPASAHLVAIDRDRDLLRDRVIGFLQSL
jgi:esterase/lipase